MHFIELTEKVTGGKRRLVNLMADSFAETKDGCVNVQRAAPGFWFTCTESWDEVCALIRGAGGQIGANNKIECDAVD